MARQRIQYKLVGRYVKGNDTVYYELISENGKEVRYTEEQMAFAVGRDQVINVRAQLYKDKVLFRGVDCDIKSLPTIQLNTDNNTTKTGTQPTSENRTAVSDNNSNIIREINNKLDRILPNYTFVESFSMNRKLSNNILYIKLIENRDYCGKERIETIFRVLYKNGYVYIVYNNEALYRSSISEVDSLIKFLLSCICVVRTDIHNSIAKSTDFTESIADAFEDYSGASSYINDVLRDIETKYWEEEMAPYIMYHACFATAPYDSNKETRLYNGYLFRGEKAFNYETHIEHGFTSTTFSLNMASQFSGTEPDSRILAFKDLKLNNIVEIGERAVCLANGEASEHELLLRPEIKVTVHNKVGTYKGIPVYLATAEPMNTKKEVMTHIVDKFVNTYKTECIYGVGLILKNLANVKDITTVGYLASDLNVILKSEKTFSLVVNTENFIANGIEIKGKENIKQAVKSLLCNGVVSEYKEDNI